MHRDEIFTFAEREKFSNKPAPVLIIQRDISIPVYQSIIFCRITSNIAVLPFMRLRLKPIDSNGLLLDSDVMAGKVLTLRKSGLAQKLGNISEDELVSLDELLFFWIGL